MCGGDDLSCVVARTTPLSNLVSSGCLVLPGVQAEMSEEKEKCVR